MNSIADPKSEGNGPMNGSEKEIKQAAMACLSALAPSGSFMRRDMANVFPVTPLENLAALTEACTKYGLPEVRKRSGCESTCVGQTSAKGLTT